MTAAVRTITAARADGIDPDEWARMTLAMVAADVRRLDKADQ